LTPSRTANNISASVKVHEYQAKALLSGFGVPVPRGKVAYTVDEAVEVAKGLGFPVVVKAQIHAGGRGKGGGVKLARSAEDAETIAKDMLGMRLKTHQTGPEGRVVRRLLVEQGMDLAGSREMYLAMVVDRARESPVFMASAQGGMDIEEVAARDPKAIIVETVHPAAGFSAVPPASSPSASACPPPRSPGPCRSCRRSTARSRPWTPRSSRSTRS
jgi:succinyl-CoA synthetase beta subunit